MTGRGPAPARRGLLYAAAGITAAFTAAPDAWAAPHTAPDRPRPATPWATSWATAQTAPTAADPVAAAGLTDGLCTARLRLSAGGQVRERYGHAFGTAPVLVGPVTADGHPVTFAGRPQEWLAAGASLTSDPVEGLRVADGSLLTVETRLPGPTGPLSFHRNTHTCRLPGAAVANLGISGNRLLLDSDRNGPGAQARFDRDVLSLPGLRTVLVHLGVNDLHQVPVERDPSRMVAAYRQLALRARSAGLRVVGATIGPFEGSTRWTPEQDAVRRQVNETVRTGRIFDAVADLDAALRDPDRPSQLLPAYDSGDGLHPGPAGHTAIAATVGHRHLR